MTNRNKIKQWFLTYPQWKHEDKQTVRDKLIANFDIDYYKEVQSVMKIQAIARQSGALAANTSTAAHLVRNLLFDASRNLSFLRRRSLLITAGYNPLENEYLEASEDEC